MTATKPSRSITAEQFNTAMRPHIRLSPPTIEHDAISAPEGLDIPEITKIKSGKIQFNNKSAGLSLPFTFKSPGLYVKRETEDGTKFIGTDRFQLLPPNDNSSDNLEILFYHKGKDTYENLREGDDFTFVKPANDQALNGDFLKLLNTHLLKQSKNGTYALINPETTKENIQGFINGTGHEGQNQNIIPVDVKTISYEELITRPPETQNGPPDALSL